MPSLLTSLRAEVGLDRPSIARISDYLLGGAHHFAVDRAAAHAALAIDPTLTEATRLHRQFVLRALRATIGAGARQVLDLGCGHLSLGATHLAARRLDPAARVFYVDHDLVVVEHARLLTDGHSGIGVLHADLRDIATVITAAATHLDLRQPTTVLLTAVLHQLDTDPQTITVALREHLAAGSHLILTHPVAATSPRAAALHRLHTAAGVPLHLRDLEEITHLLDGYTTLDPGLVPLDQWRPDGPQLPASPEVDLAWVGRLDPPARR